MDAIEWTKVKSSNIDSIGQNPDNALLIKFNNGSIYQYTTNDTPDILKNYYVKLINAESVGSYFNKVIRQDKYLNVLKIC